jgi:hypothetical protein
MKLRDSESRHVRWAALLMLVWLLWTVGMVAWAQSVAELRLGSSPEEYVEWLVVVALAAIACLGVAARVPAWGAVGGGLLLTAIGGVAVSIAARQLAHWGEIVDPIPERTEWNPWDSLAALPFTLAVPAGLVLLLGGRKRVLRQAQGSPGARLTP